MSPVPTIRFDATLSRIERSTIVRLPREASVKLPSRGQVAVRGTINGHRFDAVIEPDGTFGHWLKIDRKLERSAALGANARARVEIAPVKEWPDPSVPAD